MNNNFSVSSANISDSTVSRAPSPSPFGHLTITLDPEASPKTNKTSMKILRPDKDSPSDDVKTLAKRAKYSSEPMGPPFKATSVRAATEWASSASSREPSPSLSTATTLTNGSRSNNSPFIQSSSSNDSIVPIDLDQVDESTQNSSTVLNNKPSFLSGLSLVLSEDVMMGELISPVSLVSTGGKSPKKRSLELDQSPIESRRDTTENTESTSLKPGQGLSLDLDASPVHSEADANEFFPIPTHSTSSRNALRLQISTDTPIAAEQGPSSKRSSRSYKGSLTLDTSPASEQSGNKNSPFFLIPLSFDAEMATDGTIETSGDIQFDEVDDSIQIFDVDDEKEATNSSSSDAKRKQKLQETFNSGSRGVDVESGNALAQFFIDEHLDLEKQSLGAGASGVVYRLANSNEAYKKVRIGGYPYEANARYNQNKGDHLSYGLKHPNLLVATEAHYYSRSEKKILKASESTQDQLRDTFLIGLKMECVEAQNGQSPNLNNILTKGPLSAADAQAKGFGIASGLEELHKKGILHGDVKPDNIMIDASGVAKVCDFGLSVRVVNNEFPNIGNDNELFKAPELKSFVQGIKYDYRSEAYAFGVTLLKMVTRQSDAELVHNLQIPGDLSDPLKTVIVGLLTTDPVQRMSVAQAAALLNPANGNLAL